MNATLALALVAVLIAANGIFVAAEFSYVASRHGLIEQRAAEGDRRARHLLPQLHNLSFVLSAAQFGITATSLVVGFLAERAVGDALIRPVLDLVGLPETTSTAIAISGAFLLSTVVQMLLAELAPKNLAIARPEPIALAVAPFMRVFEIVFGPLIRVFDRAAAWMSRTVFRIEVTGELLGGHSPEELARIIATSRREGSLTEGQAELLARAIELGDRRVHEIMVPRPDVVFLDADATLEDLRQQARETGHSRFPVRGDTEDEIVGTVHIKDLLAVRPEERARTTVAELAADAVVVPESFRLRRFITLLRGQRRTFAVVVDEYGGTAGIATLEDVLEELVGEIEDEFDRRSERVRRIGRGRFLVPGNLRAERAGRLLGVELPEGEYETVAGFVIDELGHIPAEGESVEHDGCRFEVRRVEGVRVVELGVERRDPAEPQGGA